MACGVRGRLFYSNGSDLMEWLLRKRPKQQKLDDDDNDDEKEDENEPREDSRRDKANKGWGYLTPDDDSDDDDDNDETYVPSKADEEEAEVERRRKEEVERRRNIPQPSLKAYVNVTIPDLWEETLRIYGAVKQMIHRKKYRRALQ